MKGLFDLVYCACTTALLIPNRQKESVIDVNIALARCFISVEYIKYIAVRREIYVSVPAESHAFEVTSCITKKMILTKNHATPTISNPHAACLRSVNPASYFPPSPFAVSIWKPHHNRIRRAISPRIPNTRFTPPLMTFTRASFLILSLVPAQGTITPLISAST